MPLPPIAACKANRTVITLHAVPCQLQVDLSELRAAISIACRLGFASRLPNPRDSTGARRSGGAPHSRCVAHIIPFYANVMCCPPSLLPALGPLVYGGYMLAKFHSAHKHPCMLATNGFFLRSERHNLTK